MNGTHAIHRPLLAEDLTRLRRSDEHCRYAAAQRRGRIDPNPHQIDAVVFALCRTPEGGCILADKVGLGKTIEAGPVIAQLLAEGTRRVLLVVPKSLLGQWQTELYTLFGIEAREARLNPDSFEGSVRPRVGEGALALDPSKSVSIDCPFDLDYLPLSDAIVFATVCCGSIPRSALETGTVSEPRLTRIIRALHSCKYSVHDLSRCSGEGTDNFARFNMPLELGMAMALRFVNPESEHDWLVLVPMTTPTIASHRTWRLTIPRLTTDRFPASLLR